MGLPGFTLHITQLVPDRTLFNGDDNIGGAHHELTRPLTQAEIEVAAATAKRAHNPDAADEDDGSKRARADELDAQSLMLFANHILH